MEIFASLCIHFSPLSFHLKFLVTLCKGKNLSVVIYCASSSRYVILIFTISMCLVKIHKLKYKFLFKIENKSFYNLLF